MICISELHFMCLYLSPYLLLFSNVYWFNRVQFSEPKQALISPEPTDETEEQASEEEEQAPQRPCESCKHKHK